MKELIFLLKLSILIFIVWFIFNNVDFVILLQTIQKVSIYLLLFIVFTIFFQVAVLAFRWQYISKYYNNWMDSFNACMVTALFNTILPARLGEFSRIFYLKIRSNLKLKKSLVYLIIERFFDFLVLISMFLIVTFLESKTLFWQNIAIVSFIGFLTFLYLLKSKNKYFYKLFWNFPNKKIKNTLFKLHYLFSSRLNLKSIIYIIILTFIIYFVNLISLWLLFYYGMDFHFTFTQLFIIFTITSIGFIIPLNPGGIGTYHAAMVLALGYYGISKEEALATAIVMHILQVVPSSLWGTATIVLQKINYKELKTK